MKLAWWVRLHLWQNGHALSYHSKALNVCNCGKQWVR